MVKYTIIAVAGTISGAFYNFFPFLFRILSILFLLILIIKGIHKKRLLAILIIFHIFFLWSFYTHNLVNKFEKVEGSAYIQGTIQDIPERYQNKLRFTINIEQINHKNAKGQVIAIGSEHLSANAGDTIIALVKLKRFVQHCNSPGLYTSRLSTKSKQVYAFIKSLTVTGKSNDSRSHVNRIREKLKYVIENSLEHDNASFVQAILLGLQRQITPQLRENFSVSGVAHILTISGTHFGLLALAVFVVVRRLILLLPEKLLIRLTLYIIPSQVAVVSAFIALTIYLAVSGWKIPSIRAFIMFGVYLLSIFFARKNKALNALAFSAMIIIIWQPEAFFSLSFQLSFLAVLFIFLGLQRFYLDQKTLKFKITDKLKAMLFITLMAMAGTAPLIARTFHQFSFMSFFTNLVIPSFVCFLILPLIFLSSVLTTLFNLSTLPFVSVIQPLVRLVIWTVKFISSLPLADMYVASPSLIVVFLYYTGLILILKYSNNLWRFVPMVIAIILYFVTPLVVGNQVRATFLDVGQADSAIVNLPDGRVLIIDGGEHQSNPEQGPVISYLAERGISKIDFMAISHGHPDHFGGLSDVMDSFEVAEIWYNGRLTIESIPFFKKAVKKNIPLRTLKRGDLLEGNGYDMTVLHPYNTFYSNGAVNIQENNESLVFLLRLYNTSILFTGDIEAEAEWDIGHLGKWLDCDIIKVPHHGGKSSSLPYLLSAARPEVSIISVGAQNYFGHPHKETLLRYNNNNASIYRTDRDGAITVKIDKNGYKIETCNDNTLKTAQSLQDEIRNLRLLFYQIIWKP